MKETIGAMKNIKRFADIPPFTRNAGYSVHVSWKHIEDTLRTLRDSSTNFDLDPDFQRAHVWTVEKQIAYVEYILRGGVSSRDILFNHPNWMNSLKGDIVLVDGKQRLQAVREFMHGNIPAFGTKYPDYEDALPAMGNATFIFHVNNLKTRAEVLQWYLDLNSGGVVHTQDELDKVKKLLLAEQGVEKLSP